MPWWSHFSLWMHKIPLHVCIRLLYPFIYDGHLDSIHFLPVYAAAVNMNMQVFLGMLTFGPLGIYPGDLQLGHMVGLFSGFWETSIVISMTPNSRNEGPSLPTFFPAMVVICFLRGVRWIQSSFPWSLGMLNVFSNIYWPFVSLLLRIIYSLH